MVKTMGFATARVGEGVASGVERVVESVVAI